MITLEKAREAIDTQIAKNPAPARPAGRKVPTGPLSRWFNSTKSKLAKFVEKAWDYFNDAAAMSAGKGGWAPDEVRSAGMSGNLLNQAEVIQTERAASQARMLEQAERMKKMAEAHQKPPERPQEPDIRIFDDDDDEPQGPGMG